MYKDRTAVNEVLLLHRIDMELQMRDELRRNYKQMSRRLDMKVVGVAVVVAILCVAVALTVPRSKFGTDGPSKGHKTVIVERTYKMLEQI